MQSGKASTTAMRVALHRAAHQLVDSPKILDDPLSLRIIGPDALQRLQAEPDDLQGRLARGLRAAMVVRSRFAEDELAAAVASGARQYVVLGAGLDTSAYRLPHRAKGLRVFEVDFPATQEWKRELLTQAGIAQPAELTFVPVDFENQTLAAQLRSAGFDPYAPAYFSWLGVTPYLTHDAFIKTLQYIAAGAQGTTVVFDYVLAPAALSLIEKTALDAMAQRVALAGEPWRTTFTPTELIGELRALGFTKAEDAGARFLNTRYCQDRADGLKVGNVVHLMKAVV